MSDSRRGLEDQLEGLRHKYIVALSSGRKENAAKLLSSYASLVEVSNQLVRAEIAVTKHYERKAKVAAVEELPYAAPLSKLVG